MKRKKIILLLITFLVAIWNFQYFLSYIKGLYTIFVWIIGPILWLLLLTIGVFQIIRLVVEREKHFDRLKISLIIFSMLILTFSKPLGVINWEKYEDENFLVATMTGTANCKTIMQLKPNNKFKYVSICFGKDFYFGRYDVKGDTIYLHSEKRTPYMDRNSYALLAKSGNKLDEYRRLWLYQNYESKRFIPMNIIEFNTERLLQ
ncbi:MAG: hypothetical protein ABI851_16540 [Saprospiraceae bacterium]